jgi:hypothetical protein
MFYKPIVSLVTGLAVAGSVAAATTPVAMYDDNFLAAPIPVYQPIPVNQCNSSLLCCEISKPSSDLIPTLREHVCQGTVVEPEPVIRSCVKFFIGIDW